MNFGKIIINLFISTILTNSLIAEECLTGSVSILLNDGTIERLIQDKIYFELNSSKKIRTSIDKNGNFNFNCIKNFPKVGKEIQLKLPQKDNYNYFIFSPFNGKLSIPNKKNNYKKIILISKKSKIFLRTCVEHDYQTIQVFVTKHQWKAEKVVNDLRKYCVSKRSNYYCKKYIKFETFLEHDMLNNLAYKVYFGKYFPDFKSQKELKETLQFIRRVYFPKAWVRPYNKIREECR